MENGFEATSQSTDAGSSAGSGASDKGGGGVADQLKTYGVDTDQMTEAATERVSELQQLIIDEIRARPKRAIGWAAAAGVVFAADVSLRRRGRKLHHCRITACRSPPIGGIGALSKRAAPQRHHLFISLQQSPVRAPMSREGARAIAAAVAGAVAAATVIASSERLRMLMAGRGKPIRVA